MGWIFGLWRQLTFNTLRPRQNGCLFADDIFKRMFLNENIWILITISLKFVPKGPINNIPALVQIMAWRRPGDKPLSEPMLVGSLTHIYATRPQWVKYIVCLCEKNTHLSLFEWSYSSIRTPQHRILIKKTIPISNRKEVCMDLWSVINMHLHNVYSAINMPLCFTKYSTLMPNKGILTFMWIDCTGIGRKSMVGKFWINASQIIENFRWMLHVNLDICCG